MSHQEAAARQGTSGWPGEKRHGSPGPSVIAGDSANGKAHYRSQGIARSGIFSLHLSLGRADAIRVAVSSIAGIPSSDERTILLRIAELRDTNDWSIPDWNVFAIVARVTLADHPAYHEVMTVVQEKGGF